MAEPTQEQIEQIGDALASGGKISAIKIYREVTGKGLKDSKEFIDKLVPALIEQNPEKYSKLASQGTGTGCASIILFCIGITAACFAYLIKTTI